MADFNSHFTNSELSTEVLTLTTSDSLNKAWHILSLLLTLGRPAHPIELASRCTFFIAPPDFIEFLCKIKDSPLFLTNHRLVTFSYVAFAAFGRFAHNWTLTEPLSVPKIRLGDLGKKRVWGSVVRTYYRKRRKLLPEYVILDSLDEEEENGNALVLGDRIQTDCAHVNFWMDNYMNRSMNTQKDDLTVFAFDLGKLDKVMFTTDFIINSNAGLLSHGSKNTELDKKTAMFMNRKRVAYKYALECEIHFLDHARFPDIARPITLGSITTHMSLPKPSVLSSILDNPVLSREVKKDDVNFTSIMNCNVTSCSEVDEQTLRCNGMMASLNKEKTSHMENQASISSQELSIGWKQLTKSSSRLKTVRKAIGVPIEQQQCKRDNNPFPIKPKYTKERRKNSKENREKSVFVSPNDPLEPKVLPNFESFIVEEEEGSGGYGTVYRTRRKNDGATFAIKCPHLSANKHHVHNEIKMLERFGGKNFVIKYEGSFKSGNSDCLVLEHVHHDRPEVLKREIDVFQLRWYGYCMFKALASLHKQGVIHRDVKPGNFLFSRRVNKGYLIDFNLAMDLHQKYGITDKSKVGYDVSFNDLPRPYTKSIPPSKSRSFLTMKAAEAVKQEAGKGSMSLLQPKNLKKKTDQAKISTQLGSRNIIKSQGADGSGITSARDATSTRTPSAERTREPIPCQGRKELISLVQEALHGTNHAVSVPYSKRKRVAAPPEKVDRKLVYLTPMPLHSSGIAVAGAGCLKNKGDGKHKREGPCVGTKGFRAPEVLIRSPHQGPKVDIWSAGVTLLYQMIGRTPFVGDPDQNIKEIAKLRGSEDLWEVAKLHNRESSFPADLLDIQCLPSTKLRDWCKLNTRRPDFLEVMPRSLFDLVDKCLTVNPRSRTSAEEALRHEFFSPCHEALKKQRLLRQGLSLDSGGTCEG